MNEPIQAQVTAIGELMNAKIAELQTSLTAATQRAEAAEAKLRDVAYWHEAWKEAEAEREALRQDAALLAALQPNARGRVGAALAVQPTTGDKHE